LRGYNDEIAGVKLTGSGKNLDLGWDWSTGAGAGAAFRSSNFGSSQQGAFVFYARKDTTAEYALTGNTNGRLTWCNKDIAVTDFTSNGTASSSIGWRNTGSYAYINSDGKYLVIGFADFNGTNALEGVRIYYIPFGYTSGQVTAQNLVNMTYNQGITITTTAILSFTKGTKVYCDVYTNQSKSVTNVGIACIKIGT
jgi:hypothetical protein